MSLSFRDPEDSQLILEGNMDSETSISVSNPFRKTFFLMMLSPVFRKHISQVTNYLRAQNGNQLQRSSRIPPLRTSCFSRLLGHRLPQLSMDNCSTPSRYLALRLARFNAF
mgnify:CR=1 FL=1